MQALTAKVRVLKEWKATMIKQNAWFILGSQDIPKTLAIIGWKRDSSPLLD